MARYQATIQAATSTALRVAAAPESGLLEDVGGGLYDATKGTQNFGQWAANIFHDVAMGNWYDLAEDIGAPMRSFNELLMHPIDTVCANGCVRGVVGIGAPIAAGHFAGTAMRAWRAAQSSPATSAVPKEMRVLTSEHYKIVSAGTKTDLIKEHILNGELDAARRELAGEVVARKPNGVPWDHVHELQDAQRGLLNRIRAINGRLGRGNLDPGVRADLLKELGEASRLLDKTEEYSPR
jgi:hypothetical protein